VWPKTTIRTILRKVGYDVVRFPPTDSPDWRRQLLLARHRVNVLVDAGANVGQYARTVRRAGYEGRIVSFEPIPEAYEDLYRSARTDRSWECRQVALGAANGQATLHLSANSVSSSILGTLERLVVAEPAAAYVDSLQVPIQRLDSALEGSVTPRDRLLVKVDVQGYEGQVLSGAERILPQVELIEAELSLAPLYDGQQLYRDLIDLLDTMGFTLISLERGFTDKNTGHLLQADGIFVRSASRYHLGKQMV
jgi:FkbM family methyltransferase